MGRSDYGKLSHLKNGNSNRLIDLVSIKERFSTHAGWSRAPLFKNRRLNESFILKHTLRSWERTDSMESRVTATKLIIPMSTRDLDMGGYATFVENPQLIKNLGEYLGQPEASSDLKDDVDRLQALSRLPSFDPYLLNEYFSRSQAAVDACYFTISETELNEITSFVAGEIDALVRKAMGGSSSASMGQSQKLARVIFEEDEGAELRVLRAALKMTEEEYREGVFGWKGTLYYSWQASQCYDELKRFLSEMKQLDTDKSGVSHRRTIRDSIRMIAEMSMERWNRLCSRLNEYNKEFAHFVDKGDPASLKTFMHRAPSLFIEMGEDISLLKQVLDYWRFWMRTNRGQKLAVQDTIELLDDFRALLKSTSRPVGGIAQIAV